MKNTIETKTITICLLQPVDKGYHFLSEADNHVDDEKYVRVSDYVEVSFTMRPKEEIFPVKIAAIDNALNILFSKIQELQGQKQELLAISYEETSDE